MGRTLPVECFWFSYLPIIFSAEHSPRLNLSVTCDGRSGIFRFLESVPKKNIYVYVISYLII